MMTIQQQQQHLSPSPTLWQDEQAVTVQRGDMWQLGTHKLLCGDSTCAEDVARLMQGEQASLGLHDPPYGLRARMAWGLGSGKRYGRTAAPHGYFAPVTGDDKPFDPSHLLTSGSTVVIWGANHFADKLPASPAWIVWDKRVNLPSNDHSDAEVAWVSSGNTIRTFRHRWMGMIRDSERGIKRVHPTQKPIWLMEQIIEKYTHEQELVTDWYAGSGTTLLASEHTKRRCSCMEIEPHYCGIIIERWQMLTGRRATLLARTPESEGSAA